jgi:hypothetical protein
MNKRIAFWGTAALVVAAGTMPAMAQFRTAVDVSKQTVQSARASQQRIEGLDDATNKALVDYRANLKQFELLQRFNRSRAVEVDRQAIQISNLETDVANVENLQREMLPLIEEMIDNLEKFVAADVPFLEQERAERIERLRKVNADSTVSEAQRYRLVMEAFQIENEYGRTIEAYSGNVAAPEGELAVDFLRIGRTTLIYKTSDDSVLRVYDKSAGDFVDLDRSYMGDVRLGFRMAREQTAPALLGVPVTAPVTSSE